MSTYYKKRYDEIVDLKEYKKFYIESIAIDDLDPTKELVFCVNALPRSGGSITLKYFRDDSHEDAYGEALKMIDEIYEILKKGAK